MGKSDDMMRLVIIIGVVLSVWFADWAAAQQIVDVHCHNIMSGYMEMLKKHDAALEETFPLPEWNVDAHLAFMEKAGIGKFTQCGRLNIHFGGQTDRVLLGLLAAHLGLGQFVLLADRLLLGGALFGQFLELGILNRRLRLEPGQQGLFGVFLGGQAVVKAGVLEVAHAERRVSLIGNGDGEKDRSPKRRPSCSSCRWP